MTKKILLITLLAITFSFCKAQPISDLVDNFTTFSCFVVTQKNNKPLNFATGFFLRSSDSITYFITNNHVAGLEYFVNEYKEMSGVMPADSSIPDKLNIRIYDTSYGKFSLMNVDLVKNGTSTCIKFYENEKNPATLLDIIAIPLDKNQSKIINPKFVLDKSYTEKNLLLSPATDLFVVGFPLNYGSNSLLPIWKKGTVASEANLLKVGESSFFIDGTSRKGMSGSPVYYRMLSLEGNADYTASRGSITYLVGIYSAQSTDAELGTVTRLEKVFEKLNKKK